MRLIDADNLQMVSMATTEDLYTMLNVIDEAPTIDAVPVEFIMRWLAKRNSGRTNGKIFSTELVKNLIEDWRKEDADDPD